MKTFTLSSEAEANALWEELRRTWRVAAEASRPLTVVLHEYDEPRTDAQNRMFWRLMRFISKYARVHGGHFSPEAWAEHYKRSLLGTTVGPKGKEIPIPTHDLSVREYSLFLSNIEAHAHDELGLDLHHIDD
jgi:hypothetical protein